VNVKESSIYKEYLALREEVNKHKWYESERAGKDVGWAQALINWTFKFKSKWVKERQSKSRKPSELIQRAL
jgi:hypothetical protein